jgi:hypothetical protein
MNSFASVLTTSARMTLVCMVLALIQSNPRIASPSDSAGGRAALTIDDGKTLRKVPPFHGFEGVFDRELSDLMGRADRLLHFMSPTVVHVAGQGGPDVGRFSLALAGPQPLKCAGRWDP